MEWDLSHLSSSAKVWTVKKTDFFFNSRTVAVAWCSGSPSAAPSSAGKIRLSERLSESRGGLRFVQAARMSFASAYFDEQRRK
jgi:hypothetical protein